MCVGTHAIAHVLMWEHSSWGSFLSYLVSPKGLNSGHPANALTWPSASPGFASSCNISQTILTNIFKSSLWFLFVRKQSVPFLVNPYLHCRWSYASDVCMKHSRCPTREFSNTAAPDNICLCGTPHAGFFSSARRIISYWISVFQPLVALLTSKIGRIMLGRFLKRPSWLARQSDISWWDSCLLEYISRRPPSSPVIHHQVQNWKAQALSEQRHFPIRAKTLPVCDSCQRRPFAFSFPKKPRGGFEIWVLGRGFSTGRGELAFRVRFC